MFFETCIVRDLLKVAAIAFGIGAVKHYVDKSKEKKDEEIRRLQHKEESRLQKESSEGKYEKFLVWAFGDEAKPNSSFECTKEFCKYHCEVWNRRHGDIGEMDWRRGFNVVIVEMVATYDSFQTEPDGRIGELIT